MRQLIVVLGLFMAGATSAQHALSTVDQAPGATDISLDVSGATDRLDFVTIVPKGAAEGQYGKYAYVRSPTVTLQTPLDAGDYEIRLLDGENPYPTLASSALTITAPQVTLQAPDSAKAGQEIEIGWQGRTPSTGDYITVVPTGTPEGQYEKYQYARDGGSVRLLMPDAPGEYELRYNVAAGNKTLVSRGISVGGVDITMTAPNTVDAGAAFEVSFQGNDNPRDFITIVPPETPEREYARYEYARQSPLIMTAPDVAGEYEIRYLSAQRYLTLAASKLTVGGVQATLTAPDSAEAGARIEIKWTGPDNAQDYVTLVPAGTADGEYDRYVYTNVGSPMAFDLVDVEGDFEIRYQTGQENRVLARRPITLTPPSATIDAPDTVEARAAFPVSWQGSGNPQDYIAVTAVGDPTEYSNYAYVRRGNPVTLQAPSEPGQYELHYLTAGDRSLASQSITVTPRSAPGYLQVVGRDVESPAVSPTNAVEIILDASGSMLQRLDGERRINLAKSAIAGLIDNALPASVPYAFRAFGHVKPDSCDTELLTPLSPLDRAAAKATVAAVQAHNLAKTPIADSLAQVRNDLAGVTGEAVVVLVTDGEETCDGNPEAEIRRLLAEGFDVRVNIVGFAIDEFALKQEFESWAAAGGGSYFDAQDADGLAQGITDSLKRPFAVFDGAGNRVGSGFVGGERMELPAGAFVVRVAGADYPVDVNADETAVVTVP